MKTPREVLLDRHRKAETELDRMWRATLRRGLQNTADGIERVPPFAIAWKLWRELVWPCRRIWAGLTCAWVVILVLNIASSEPAPQVANKSEPRSREEMQALIEQRHMLAQMIGPVSTPSNQRRSNAPGPRSDRMVSILAA
jgi:hypothetical protein